MSSSSCQKHRKHNAGTVLQVVWEPRPAADFSTVDVLFCWGGAGRRAGVLSAFPLRTYVTERCKWKAYE